jgi:hypothetical protein
MKYTIYGYNKIDAKVMSTIIEAQNDFQAKDIFHNSYKNHDIVTLQSEIIIYKNTIKNQPYISTRTLRANLYKKRH